LPEIGHDLLLEIISLVDRNAEPAVSHDPPDAFANPMDRLGIPSAQSLAPLLRRRSAGWLNSITWWGHSDSMLIILELFSYFFIVG
jgi:hypothetical protein